RPAAAQVAAPAAGSPYHIAAGNMTGGRGPEGDVLDLTDVTVTREGMVLNADAGRYLRATGRIDLTGHVRVRDSTTTVTCDHASFNENEDRLNLDGNVVITDRDAVLKAPSGWYDRKAGEAHLVGGVTGSDKRQRLVADEAVYDRDSMVVHARGDVRGFDDENKLELDAGTVDFHRRTRVAVATGEPVLRTRDDDGRLTTLRARTLRVNSLTRVAEALDSVRVERDTLRATGDYAVFDDSTGHGRLLGHPRAWDNETNVTGDTLETIAVRRRLERVIVRGNAVMDYAGIRETNRGETSRLTGRSVDVFVHDNVIDSLMALGGARNAYTAPSREGHTNESNLASGDTILVYFRDRKIDRARVQGGARGEYRPSVLASDTAAVRQELVRYDGRRIDFVVPKSQIVLDGDAHLTYRTLELHARRVEFDSGRQTLLAEGSPQLVDKGDKVDGQLMSYDLETHSGTIYQASTAYEKGLYHGERIRKAGDNELDVLGGSYSTCDLPDPHYHFSARQMKIYLKDKLVAKSVVFYVRNVPVLALPFYVFPIKPGRHSGFLFPAFEFGFNNRTGQFIRNAGYYWAPNDYFDLTAAGDYYQADPSYVLRAEGNYKLLYAFEGTFQGRYQHNDATATNDYAFDGSHSQQLTDRTRLVANGNFVSSRAYNQSANSGATLADRLNTFLRSNVSVSHAADWASFSGVVERFQNLDADLPLEQPLLFGPFRPAVGTTSSLPGLTVTAPSLSVSFPTRTLGSWGMLKDTPAGKALQTTYFSLNAHFLSLATYQGFVQGYNPDSSTIVGRRVTTRRGFASSTSLSDSRRWWGWLNVSPSVSANGVVFDFDETGRKVVPAATWSSQLGVSSTFYRTFTTPVSGLSFRHSLFPTVALAYSPDFPSLQIRDSTGQQRSRFNGFGDIGISGFRAASLAFGLEQRLQAKYQHGSSVTRLDNLLSWSVNGAYNFLWREQGQAHPLSPLSTSLRLQPPGLLAADVSGVVDPYQGRPLRSLGMSTGLSFGSGGPHRGQTAALAVDQTQRSPDIAPPELFRDSWRASLAYSYSGGYSTPVWSAQQTLNGVLAWQFTPNWHLDYSTAFDVTRQQQLTQRFSLTRRLHCWDLEFSRSFTPGAETEYYFRLGIVDQREVYVERGTRVQSFGGIQ
ncbi:MAG TPA: putative LPS assembly protein LptD, partial [Candidatus Eisenbacteria bacterium]|nr:putative LPS assembly protein LptD [Candidatus Eisenbacteria bacterium]